VCTGPAGWQARTIVVRRTRNHNNRGDRDFLQLNITIVVHTGAMATKEKTVRQSVTMPAKVAAQVRTIAKRRRLSASRMVVELLEEGIESRKQKENAFFELAERFRAAADPDEVSRLGDQLGKMMFDR
jgi:hypothetical protein